MLLLPSPPASPQANFTARSLRGRPAIGAIRPSEPGPPLRRLWFEARSPTVRSEDRQRHRQGPQTTQVWVYFIFDKFMTIKRWLVFPTFSVDFVSPAGVYVAPPFLRSPFSVFPSG